jgi:hypothetical protein
MTDNQSIKDRLKIYIKYLGIGQSKFEKQCNLSNGYINNSKGNFGASKLEYILKSYPELNREWLLYGEGEMLKSSVSIENGDGSTQIIGDGNHVGAHSTIDIALQEITAQRKLVEKAHELIQEQIRINKEQTDKFLAIIEKLTEK